jgi:hypothetical protein
MKISEIFYLYQGNGFELANMESDSASNVNFVSRASENNGVAAKVNTVKGINPFPSGAITAALGGSVLSSFVQLRPFYTAFHIMVLIPKKKMSLEDKLFYCHCIKMNAYRYGYGRQANKTLKDINLPPLPQWLKKYHINYSRITTKIKSAVMPLHTKNWKKFRIGDLFRISGTKTTKLDELESYGSGSYPYITTQSANNGVAGYYNFKTETKNCLTIDSAVSGFCAYQGKDFSASDHVEKLTADFSFNKYIGIFLATIINMDNYRYSYGRKFNQTNIKQTKVKLPVDKNGNPNWRYMESYIKSLPYGDKI